MTSELAVTQLDASALEQVLISGDLSKLTSPQRVQYYKRVCESIGLNPLTKPFDYIQLNGKLTLYAKKDATDQLRSLKGVSIDDVDISENTDHFVVKVKGHDTTGRADVEIGVVKKSDMQGNLANAQMKAVTKAKRRLTLSLCGLGWLDETEVETIKDAKPVTVEPETGEIVDGEFEQASAPEPVKAEPIVNSDPMTPERACAMVDSDGKKYGELDSKELSNKTIGISKGLKTSPSGSAEHAEYQLKLDAIKVILRERANGSIQ